VGSVGFEPMTYSQQLRKGLDVYWAVGVSYRLFSRTFGFAYARTGWTIIGD
jgi:hypothetical protein